MTINITLRDLLTDILMLAAIVLILIQRDETGYMLALDFKGLLVAVLLLAVLPLHHFMLVCHSLVQDAVDYFS